MDECAWVPVKVRELTEVELQQVDYNYSFEYVGEMPAASERVLITTSAGSVEVAQFIKDAEWGCYFDGYEGEDEVVAWRPLPAPYIKGVSE